MKVSLNEIVDGLHMVSQNILVYYDRNTHRTEFAFTEDAYEYDEETIPHNALFLPSHYEINEYQMMLNFILTLPEGEMKVQFYDAINGRGAFRNFKKSTLRFSIEREWYVYKRLELTEIAKDWCKDNGLEFS